MRNVKSSRSASPITFFGSLIQKRNQKENPAGPIQQSKQPSHKFDTRSLKVLAVNFFAMRCRPASGRDIADGVCNISASGHATYRGLHVVELGRKHPENRSVSVASAELKLPVCLRVFHRQKAAFGNRSKHLDLVSSVKSRRPFATLLHAGSPSPRPCV